MKYRIKETIVDTDLGEVGKVGLTARQAWIPIENFEEIIELPIEGSILAKEGTTYTIANSSGCWYFHSMGDHRALSIDEVKDFLKTEEWVVIRKGWRTK